MLYYYIMSHHHHSGATHPAPTITPSLLRFSAPQRIAVAAALIVLIWASALWAIR
jgi:hypothetical protein